MKRLSIALLFGVLVAGCAPTYRLVPRDVDSTTLDGSQPGSTIVRQWQQYRITVRPLGRKDLPKSLSSAYTVFQAIVENTGGQEASLSLSQFALLDSSQNQRFPLQPGEIQKTTAVYYPPNDQFYWGFGAGRHYRYSHFGYSHRFGLFPEPVLVEEQRTVQGLLRAGAVLPDARVHGLLFFERIPMVPGKELDLLFLSEGKIRMVFPLKIIEGS